MANAFYHNLTYTRDSSSIYNIKYYQAVKYAQKSTQPATQRMSTGPRNGAKYMKKEKKKKKQNIE